MLWKKLVGGEKVGHQWYSIKRECDEYNLVSTRHGMGIAVKRSEFVQIVGANCYY